MGTVSSSSSDRLDENGSLLNIHPALATTPSTHRHHEAHERSLLGCQQNSAAITRSANRPEEEKSSVSMCDGMVFVCVHVCVCVCVCVCAQQGGH